MACSRRLHRKQRSQRRTLFSVLLSVGPPRDAVTERTRLSNPGYDWIFDNRRHTRRLFSPSINHLVDGRPNPIGAFWFDQDTQFCLTYGPDFAFFNDLETVQSQQISWLRLRAPQHFLGKTRAAGWSVVALP